MGTEIAQAVLGKKKVDDNASKQIQVTEQLHSATPFGTRSPGGQISMFPAPKVINTRGLPYRERFWLLLVPPYQQVYFCELG